MGLCQTAERKKMNMKSTFFPGSWIPIVSECVNVGLGWDFHRGNTFDLDASITAYNECMELVDSIYFSHKEGLNGAIYHHGDNLTGEGSGDDEVITIKLKDIPPNIFYLAVTVNSYKKNSIIQAKSGYIRLYEKKSKEEIGRFILSQTKDCIGLLLGLFQKNPSTGGWFFRVMIDPIEGNVVTKSIDSIKVLIQGYSPTLTAPQAPSWVSKHPFPGEATFVPGNWMEVEPQWTYVGLGWDILPGQVYDLDASIMIFSCGNLTDIVYHKNMNSKDGSIIHNGDNKTGLGEGDDETMTINFPMLSPSVDTLAVLVNSFKGNNMSGVNSGFIRLFTQNGPIGCHILGQGQENLGLLLGLFRRDIQNKRWFFQVTIEPLHETTADQCVEQVKAMVIKYGIPS